LGIDTQYSVSFLENNTPYNVFHIVTLLMKAVKMKYNIYLNQQKATEWGITPQQAILFSYLHDLPSWADCYIVSGIPHYYITKQKIITEMPLLNCKPDTIYRWIKQLSELGVIHIIHKGIGSLVGITKKGATWNGEMSSRQMGISHGHGSEGVDEDPTLLGSVSGKTSDVHPTNNNTNNNNTKTDHHPFAIEQKQGGGEFEIGEYLELVVKPISQGKNDPQGYFESVRSRLLRHGLSGRDLAQLASIRPMAVKESRPPGPDLRPTIVSESWENAMTILKNTLGKSCFNLWIAPLRCLRDDTVIELAGPDRFFCAHIKNHFLEQINNALSGREVQIWPDI
jgi:hypothetical protein